MKEEINLYFILRHQLEVSLLIHNHPFSFRWIYQQLTPFFEKLKKTKFGLRFGENSISIPNSYNFP